MLEERLASLEEAIKENTAIQTKVLAALNGAGKAATGKPAGAAAGNKPAGAAASKPATKNTDKGPTLDDIKKKFGAYLSVSDADEREARKANVAAINEHFNVAKISDADPEQFAEAIALLEQFENGENPFGDGDTGGGEALV